MKWSTTTITTTSYCSVISIEKPLVSWSKGDESPINWFNQSSIYIVVLSSLMRAIVRYDIRLNCSDNRQQWKCRNSIHIYWIGSNLIRKFKARTHAYSAQMCILVIYQTIWIASLCHPKCTFYAPFHIQITFPQQQYNTEIVHVYLCHRSLLFVQNDSTPQNTLFWIHIEYINFKRPSQFSIIFYTK